MNNNNNNNNNTSARLRRTNSLQRLEEEARLARGNNNNFGNGQSYPVGNIPMGAPRLRRTPRVNGNAGIRWRAQPAPMNNNNNNNNNNAAVPLRRTNYLQELEALHGHRNENDNFLPNFYYFYIFFLIINNQLSIYNLSSQLNLPDFFYLFTNESILKIFNYFPFFKNYFIIF